MQTMCDLEDAAAKFRSTHANVVGLSEVCVCVCACVCVCLKEIDQEKEREYACNSFLVLFSPFLPEYRKVCIKTWV